MFTLKLLGTASIDGSDGPVIGRAAQGPRLALLALLAIARDRPVSRDKLIALLWPESPTDRARHHLSDTVYIVRSALGDDVIRSSGDDLALNAHALESDVALFERLVEEGHLESAVELFDGPLLDGFHLHDSAEFERWLDAERARLDQHYAALLESLAEACERRGELAGAVDWWRRSAARDPYSGRIALRLMRALDANGDRAGALQHARVHAVLLREEFDAGPDPEVAAFAERLRLEPPARPAPAPLGVARADAPSRHAEPEPPPATGAHTAGRRPVRAHAGAAATLLLLLAIGGLYATRGAHRPIVPPARSIAVLPFINLGPDPQNAYFSDGLSEEIIAALSRVDGLRVAARTSSFALRDRRLGVRAIGDTLSVAAVLEGSVRQDGHRLRVTAQLIDAATGYHIWSQDYDRELADIFAVQQEIASAIASALELRLAPRTPEHAARSTPDLEAYDLYLRGLFLRNSLSGDALRQATQLFDRAIEREPDFALAYAAKASVVAPLIYFGHVRWEQGVAEIRALVDRALELDPTLGEAYASLGILELFFEWDWPRAEAALRRAIALNPSDPHAYHHLANYLHAMGRFDDAVAARKRAVALDPLNARTRIVLGTDHLRAGDHDAAVAQLQRAFQLDPVNPLVLGLGPSPPRGPADVYLDQGRYDEAAEHLLRIATLRDASPEDIAALRAGYAASGMPGFWRAWLAMDLRQSGSNPNPLRMASLWALIGDTTQAFRWLDLAVVERNPGLIYLPHEPAFEPMRSHPHVARILTDMKLPR